MPAYLLQKIRNLVGYTSHFDNFAALPTKNLTTPATKSLINNSNFHTEQVRSKHLNNY